MKIEKYCLFCGRPNHSINYTCHTKKRGWHDEYRALDLRLTLTDEDKRSARASFNNYDFSHPLGMLQYPLLPYRQYKPPGVPRVGCTSLHRLKNMEGAYGCQLYLKNEGNNPSGCFKDRETLICLLNSRRRNLKHAVIYSSGNAAASAALFAQMIDFRLITFVAGDTYPEKIDFIRRHGSDVVVVGDENITFEEGFRLFAHVNAGGIFAQHSYDNWSVRNPYRVQGDKTTAIEIIRQLSDMEAEVTVPDFVVVPSANGSCLSGMWKGFQELHELGITNSLPKMVSTGIAHANPVYKAVTEKVTDRPSICKLDEVDEQDKRIGSIILAEEGYDSMEAAKAVIASGGLAVEVHKEGIQSSLLDFLENEKALALQNRISPEPASLTALAAVKELKERGVVQPHHKVASVITGHALKARQMMHELLEGRPELIEVVDEIGDAKEDRMQNEARTFGNRLDVPPNFKDVVNAFLELRTAVPT